LNQFADKPRPDHTAGQESATFTPATDTLMPLAVFQSL